MSETLTVPTAEEVRAFLNGLGTTADEVAASLRARGVTGRRVAYQDCPIANALKQQFPGTTYVSVGGGHVYLQFGPTDPSIDIAQPTPVYDFISTFDLGGNYPELVA